jgi:hypothetical protein
LIATDPRPADQIIEELRRNRKQLLRFASGSIDTLCGTMKELKRTSAGRSSSCLRGG